MPLQQLPGLKQDTCQVVISASRASHTFLTPARHGCHSNAPKLEPVHELLSYCAATTSDVSMLPGMLLGYMKWGDELCCPSSQISQWLRQGISSKHSEVQVQNYATKRAAEKRLVAVIHRTAC